MSWAMRIRRTGILAVAAAGAGLAALVLIPAAGAANLLMPLVITLAATVEADAHEYELEGRLTASLHLAQGGSRAFDSARFHIYVKDCAWLMRATLEAGGTAGSLVERWDCGFDGEARRSVATYRSPQNGDNWLGAVDPEQVPTSPLMPHLGVAWFATASSCYLNSAAGTLLPPHSATPVHVREQVIIRRNEVEPQLPRYVAFLSDGYDHRFDGTAAKFPPPFDKGFTNAIFEVLRFTNVAGLELPAAFSLRSFQPGPSGLESLFECAGEVEQVRAECSLRSFLPEIPAGREGQVRDFRFVSANARSAHDFQYGAARWLSQEEVRAMPAFAEYAKWEAKVSQIPKVAQATGSPSVPQSSRARTLTFCLLAGSVPLLIFLLVKNRKMNAN